MAEYAKQYPGYDFAQNAGYGTQKTFRWFETIRRDTYSQEDFRAY